VETGGRECREGRMEGRRIPILGMHQIASYPLLKSHPGNEPLPPPQIPTLGVGHCLIPLLKFPPWECLASYPSLNPHPENCLISLLESLSREWTIMRHLMYWVFTVRRGLSSSLWSMLSKFQCIKDRIRTNPWEKLTWIG